MASSNRDTGWHCEQPPRFERAFISTVAEAKKNGPAHRGAVSLGYLIAFAAKMSAYWQFEQPAPVAIGAGADMTGAGATIDPPQSEQPAPVLTAGAEAP